MSARVLTLFGEEVQPEEAKPLDIKNIYKKGISPKKNDDNEAVIEENPADKTVQIISNNNALEEITKPKPFRKTTYEFITTKEELDTIYIPAKFSFQDKSSTISKPISEIIITENEKSDSPFLEPENVISNEEIGNKQYYTIGEVAELLKVKTSQIRFWTTEFNFKMRTTRKGDRLYTTEQIKQLKIIHTLIKENGFTLTGAKAKMKEKPKKELNKNDFKVSLLELRYKLVNLRKQIK